MSEEHRDLEVLWTPQQVAKYFSITQGAVYRWLSQGKIIDPTKIVRISNKVRIPRSEVERIARGMKEKITN